jgi:choline dehydrogenase
LVLNTWNTSGTWNHFAEKSDKASKAFGKGSYWPSGKMLGGSSGVNVMMYVRGNRRDYDQWRDLGNTGWGYEDILKYFKKSEGANTKDFVKKFHSNKGPLSVDNFPKENEIVELIVEAAKELGYPELDDCNNDKHFGFGTLKGTIGNGERWSTAKAFLNPIKERKNLHIIKNAQVKKLIVTSDKLVRGVTFQLGERELSANTRKEVILSAGSVGSARILLNSGIGPSEHLKQLKVPITKNLPVGKNLQDHVSMIFPITIDKSTAQPQSLQQIADDFNLFLRHRTGPLTGVGTMNIMGFLNTVNITDNYPDLQITYAGFPKQTMDLKKLLSAFGYSDYFIEKFYQANQKAYLLKIVLILLNPKSRGKIELRSTDPLDDPKIFANYLEEQEDVDTLVRGVKVLLEFLKTKSFAKHEAELLDFKIKECDKFEHHSNEYWECYVRYFSTTLYHPVGK